MLERTDTLMMPPPSLRNPEGCGHERVQRIGIQTAPRAPRRLYLVNCRLCGTTLTTRTLREQRDAKKKGKPPDSE